MPRIDAVEIYRVHLPLVYPFRTAYGTDDAVEPVLVKLRSGRFHGWGEAQPFICPTYCPEYSAGVFLLIKNVFAPAIVGHEIDSGDALRQMIACFKGNFFAKGALDMAWWDLFARTRGEPLWKTLGGKGPDIEVGADFGAMERIDVLLGKIDQALKAGYKRVKLKYAPGWDLPVIQAVRGAFPDAVFHIDCNSGYTLEDLGMFKQLDRYNLAMIEQPLMYDDLVDHAALQDQICTPICLDESVTSLDKVRKAIEIGSCRWINIKPVRVGGHTPALAIHDLCQEAGIGCWVGGMLESGIGAAHCLAAATLSNIKYPCDVFPSSRFFHKDLSVPDWHLSGPSRMTAVDAPGIGCDPDPAMLEACAVEKAVIGQGG